VFDFCAFGDRQQKLAGSCCIARKISIAQHVAIFFAVHASHRALAFLLLSCAQGIDAPDP